MLFLKISAGFSHNICNSSMEGANCNTKLRKKFISVAVWYSFLQQPKELKKTKEEIIEMSKFEWSKLIIPYLNHI